MSIFNELKRRNVFKVGFAYVVVAWLVAQVLQLVFESFGTPDWAIKTVLVLLATGLPFALFFAWAFEMTPDGIKRESQVDRSQSITTQTSNRLNRMIFVVMALAPWLDTSMVRSGRYRPMFKWWFWVFVVNFVVLTWVGAMPAEGIYPYIALIGSAYWFAYFLIILPLLGVIEKPLPQPETIEEDFAAHKAASGGTHTVVSPAE